MATLANGFSPEKVHGYLSRVQRVAEMEGAHV